MKIKHYKLKQNITPEQIKDAAGRTSCIVGEGGSWISGDSVFFVSHDIDDGAVSVGIAFPQDLSVWNDYDHVLVLDENFCQPYTPFYEKLQNEDISFPYLDAVVTAYNEFMDAIGIFQEVSD